MPGLEALALCCDDAASAFVQPVGSPVQIPVMKMGVNDGFWKVFSFRFLEGKPFTEADFRSGMPVAVIARSLAKRLYGEGSAVGQTLSLDFTSFRVVGVVDDVSYLMDRVFSQVWYPYTQVPDFEEPGPILGGAYARARPLEGLYAREGQGRYRQGAGGGGG